MSRLKEVRIEKGFGQKEVAAAIGVAQPTVSAWERNTKTPTLKNFIALSALYHVSVEYLSGNCAEKKEKPTPVSESEPFIFSDEELVRRLRELPPEDVPRVRDFVQGLLAARKETPSQKK